MSNESIFQHTSFFTLNETQKTRVRDYAQSRKFTLIDTHEVFKLQADLSVSLDFWDTKVNVLNQFTTTSDDFRFMNAELLPMLKDEMLFALYIFCARYQLELAEGRGDILHDHGCQIIKCNRLINDINKALGLVDKTYVTDNLPTVMDDGVNDFLGWIRVFNERRLYWVWAGRGGLLGSLISLLPDGFYNKTQALSTLDIPVPFTGFLSWGLYYFRFFVRVGLLLKHTIPGFWMSDEEQKIPWQERLYAQIQTLKFDLMNDFVWASGNLACYFWLFGSADFYGGLLTAGLLLMDVYIAVKSYCEAFEQYTQDMQRFRLGLELLDESNAPAYQVHSLMSTQRQCKLEWDYKLYAIYLDMIYAILLLAAFSLLYCFFLPIALSGSTALLLGVAGTVLCFTMNALFAAIKQGVDVCKSVELSNNAALDCVENNPNNLDLTLSKSEWRYHQDIIKYKQACLIQSLLVDFLVPPVMFVALVFMPVSIGLVVVCAGLFLAVASYLYVDKTYKHDMTCLPKFSPDANIEGENVINPIIRQGFFGKGAHVLSKQRELELELGVMGCLRQAL